MTSNPQIEHNAQQNREHHKLTINTTLNPDISMLITSSTITSIEETRVWLHISIEVSFMVLVYATSN